MEVRLILQTGTKRRLVKLKKDVSTIGRAKGCTVRVPSAEVSRRHCRLLQHKGIVLVEDLSSVNGTYLNGKAVVGRQPVRPGDKLEVGPLRFLIAYELTGGASGRLNAYDSNAEALAADSGPDFLEDSDEVEAVQWVDDGTEAEAVPEALAQANEEEPTEHGTSVLGDDDEWELPADLQLGQLLEPLDDDADRKKKRK